jgi:hypothetical protein
MAYALGPVKPHVRAAANAIGEGYGVTTIYGVAARSYASDHPLGLALDFMVGSEKIKGDNIAAYCAKNAQALKVTYVIWYQKIFSVERASEGWRDMEDRGSTTANHMDHVHVSFASISGAQTVGFSIPSIPPIAPIVPWDIVPGQPSPPEILGGVGAGVDAALAPLTSLASAIGWLTDSHNLIRVGIVIGGAVLLLFALIRMGLAPSPQIASKIRKVTAR